MSKTFDSFVSLCKRQQLYNVRVRAEKHESTVQWTETYLLGIVSQIDSVLREISWKRHRIQEEVEPNRNNVAHELADLTKYILSLWELWGFSADDIIEYCNKKSDLLETIWYEDREEIPDGQIVIITDIDGTLADWRATFRSFLEGRELEIRSDDETSLDMECEIGLNYGEYNILKNLFESEGGYSRLIAYRDAVNFIKDAASSFKAYIISFTARPFHKHKRIWTDTWEWIRSNGLPISQLRSGSESRVAFALGLSKTHKVILLEDNPEFMLRAANSGIMVIARRHPYNAGIHHDNIITVDSFDQLNLKEILCQE